MPTKMKFHLRPKTKRKRKSPDNYNLFSSSFSYIQSSSQPYNAPPIPRPVSVFLQLVLVDGIPLSSCTMYRYICAIFILDDISTREQFAFLVYSYRVEAIFYNLCTVLYGPLCGLTNSSIHILSTEAVTVHGVQKVLLNVFRMAKCFCCLSQNAIWCALFTAVKNYNKS